MAMNKRLDFSGQSIFIGIDVHNKSWAVSIRTEQFEHKAFNQPPDPEVLAKYLKRNFPRATYHAAYEAGHTGFWIYDKLVSLGVECSVIHPADIPITDKDKRHKSDPRDCRRIASALKNGELNPIYVPALKAREDRALIRERMRLIQERTRIKNRVKSLLRFHGIAIPTQFTMRCWSQDFLEWLYSSNLMHSSSGKNALLSLVEQIRFYNDQNLQITRKIRKLARGPRYKKDVDNLVTIPGIGIISAMVWLTELVDINRFKSFDKLACYIGLIPRERSSGEKQAVLGLDTRGNRILKTMLIENSWAALRNDPGMINAYQHLTQRMNGNRAIIRIARKLLRRIRYVLINEKTYQVGLA
ncbi:MAG: IS110 family transposase [Candidatus Brocadiales bacterium]|nr:IS110 family transposase [Candidatus Brocadiales bacterium]